MQPGSALILSSKIEIFKYSQKNGTLYVLVIETADQSELFFMILVKPDSSAINKCISSNFGVWSGSTFLLTCLT